MNRFFAVVLLCALPILAAPAHAQPQPRAFTQAELDALLAPIALYPDALISHVLVAATYPQDLREAASWSRANPQLQGDDAVRAAEPQPWHPSVKALVAFPDLLARMDESPRWTAELGVAFLEQEPYVMDTIQALRRRAQASGMLQSNEYQRVIEQDSAVVVQPVHPYAVYVPYYNPYVVYGPWWWPHYRPVLWRPWYPRPIAFASFTVFHNHVDWHRRHVVNRWHGQPRREHRPVTLQPVAVPNSVQRPQGAVIQQFSAPRAGQQLSAPRPAERQRRENSSRVQGAVVQQPISRLRTDEQQRELLRTQAENARRTMQQPSAVARPPQLERRESRLEPRQQHRQEARQHQRRG